LADRTPSLIQTTRPGIAGIPLPRTQAAILESVEYVLLFLLFFFCSTPYRITFNSFSIGLAELAALIYILWRWTTGGRKDEKREHAARWWIRGLSALAVWSGVVWILSVNWEARRTITSDWLLAVLVFLCLLRSPVKDWKRIALLLILAALPSLILGGWQHALGIGLAPKDLTGWGEDASSYPVSGLFQHSNDLAVYLYWPVLLSTGLSFAYQTRKRLIFAALAVLFGLILYWTISRSTLITLAFLAVLLPFLLFLPRRRDFLLVLAAGAAIAALVLVWILLTHSIDQINLLLSGRLNLWDRALQFIKRDPLFLPFGYLTIPPEWVRIFWLPHNIYLLFWIEYGWMGILLMAGAAVLLLREGLTRYEKLRSNRPAAVVWLGLAGIFFINGLVSLYFHETHFILLFISITAIWISLLREIDSTSPSIPGAPSDRGRTLSGLNPSPQKKMKGAATAGVSTPPPVKTSPRPSSRKSRKTRKKASRSA
jgi:hypothetical protein